MEFHADGQAARTRGRGEASGADGGSDATDSHLLLASPLRAATEEAEQVRPPVTRAASSPRTEQRAAELELAPFR
jgi:hypothetical protein